MILRNEEINLNQTAILILVSKNIKLITNSASQLCLIVKLSLYKQHYVFALISFELHSSSASHHLNIYLSNAQYISL